MHVNYTINFFGSCSIIDLSIAKVFHMVELSINHLPFFRLLLNLAQPWRVNFLPESPREYGSYEILADTIALLIA